MNNKDHINGLREALEACEGVRESGCEAAAGAIECINYIKDIIAVAEAQALAAPSVANGAPTGELLPLPEPDGDWAGDDWFTADSMRTYTRAAIAALPKPVVAMTDERIKEIIFDAHADDGMGEDIDLIKLCRAILAAAGPDAALVEALTEALAVIDDYLEYEHNGDPWTEDARAMGEMDIDDYARDGRIEKARAALAAHAGQGAKT